MNRSVSLSLMSTNMEDVTSLEFILLGDLRDLVEEEPFDEVTCKWLKAVVDALLETLSLEFARQDEGDGYLGEVVEQDPNWANYVDQLAEERRTIFQRLREVQQQLRSSREVHTMASQLRSELKDWMLRLTALHRHERRLVQTAFNLDVGTGD